MRADLSEAVAALIAPQPRLLLIISQRVLMLYTENSEQPKNGPALTSDVMRQAQQALDSAARPAQPSGIGKLCLDQNLQGPEFMLILTYTQAAQRRDWSMLSMEPAKPLVTAAAGARCSMASMPSSRVCHRFSAPLMHSRNYIHFSKVRVTLDVVYVTSLRSVPKLPSAHSKSSSNSKSSGMTTTRR